MGLEGPLTPGRNRRGRKLGIGKKPGPLYRLPDTRLQDTAVVTELSSPVPRESHEALGLGKKEGEQ